ncbi:glycosyltransferase family 4 protein [Saccharicrinis aurantiacus]|uniref:glycosyltransferase family 4 protein n=1 Tax=Saccharicrinis aurantiacus TaxID=1849719 RepID=UPI00249078D3|nr:glycosyltransferase family 4 protein [Saccharicrinis aurantiacus]
MNILVLYTSLTDYWVACMRYDYKINGNKYLVFRQTPNPNAPFQLNSEEGIEINNQSDFELAALQVKIKEFNPDMIYISGWVNKKYLAIAKSYKSKGIPTITGLDNQWKGNLRQRIGALLAPWKVKKYFSHIWVAGMLQYEFARQLKFKPQHILNNLYCADLDKFNNPTIAYNKRFVFIGRLVHHKGVDLLMEAFKKLKAQHNSDWELHVIGNGDYIDELKQIEGVVHYPFIQPQDLPAELHKGGVFVLPSRYEAWGVVVQEAAAAAMPMICSASVGAARHLLQNGYNGYTINDNSVSDLCKAMHKISTLPKDTLTQMAKNSGSISTNINHAMWSAQLNEVK